MKSLLSILLLLFCLSCEKSATSNESVINIKENKTSCTGYEGQTECFLVQQGNNIGTHQWDYFYEQIQGFTYQPGFEYKLLVKKESIINPAADAPSVKYTLIKELSKVAK